MWALRRKIVALAIGSMLKSLASEEKTETTIAGLLAAAVLAIPALDLQRLIEGDPVQVAIVFSGVLVALIGIIATREKASGKTTFFGAVAGALYAVQGSVEAIVTAVVIAVLGYMTGRPVPQVQPWKEGEDQEAGGVVPRLDSGRLGDGLPREDAD